MLQQTWCHHSQRTYKLCLYVSMFIYLLIYTHLSIYLIYLGYIYLVHP